MAEKNTPIRVAFYNIEKTIGRGNFAVVKLATHVITKSQVAIKIIDKTQLASADLKRAYREVRVLKKLHHPHIIRLYQVMETKNMLYIVTEYAPRGEIFDHIARHGRLPEPAARRLYWQVLSAVDYCHKRGVVHRDLKAENLLLDVDGSLKVADFGFSTWWNQESLLSTWCGSPPYAAPEVFEGRQYIGPEVDIWSLGVVLYVLVCGALPFDAATLPALRDRVLSARYRVPYFMSSECESLIRKMLVRDPARRYTIDQVKRHRWMQLDGPPRLLPTPAHPTVPNVNPKQYLDPGLVPDVVPEPNEQILRLMASLGIDSSRTRESLRQQCYDHHSAIYFLLLERLRQHKPGSHRYSGSSSAGPPSVVRMLSTDQSTCRRPPRRPSSVAEHAMRKMIPGPNPEIPQNVPAMASALPAAGTDVISSWKYPRSPRCGPSQTSSVDEGVADMDNCTWDPDSSVAGSIAGSSIRQSNASSIPRSHGDWKWPTRGSVGSSVLISTDLSQTSGSPRESVSGSQTTLSSWDSAWEPGTGLAASLPSCTGATGGISEERRNSIIGPESPLSPTACLTADRLWVPEPNPSGSPTEFRLGRRASDGLVGRRNIPFPGKLEGNRAGGVAAIADKVIQGSASEIGELEEGCIGEPAIPEPPLNLLRSPVKRPSLPDTWRLPDFDSRRTSREHSGIQWYDPGASPAQLHRQMMGLRLHRRPGTNDPQDLGMHGDAGANARKSVLRQQSYKLAQQQQVLPPLPGNPAGMCLGMDSRVLSLHAHEEEEEDEEDENCLDNLASCSRPQWVSNETSAWQNLPVTMSECKLIDSNHPLNRLSPLLQLDHYQSSRSPIPSPLPWDSQLQDPHLNHTNAYMSLERMDTSGS